ncbi:MAG: hypothetical protein ACTTKD_00330 [Peptoanaerobacter stomatis]|uniref:hypothetical protein n=1 Tax=Peptoanaerobacter stomatis TaxID=796937 RepID=UPI003FA18A38
MSKLRINFIDNWEKKDVNLEELTRALEDGNSSVIRMRVLRRYQASGKNSRKEAFQTFT